LEARRGHPELLVEPGSVLRTCLRAFDADFEPARLVLYGLDRPVEALAEPVYPRGELFELVVRPKVEPARQVPGGHLVYRFFEPVKRPGYLVRVGDHYDEAGDGGNAYDGEVGEQYRRKEVLAGFRDDELCPGVARYDCAP
jgi:hypothetical protein